MNYIGSIQDFFKTPKWGMNLLLGIVATIIPFVGAIVLAGWLITGFWARKDDENPATFPDFNFEQFMKYLERGVWPFLVNLVTGLVLSPVFAVIMFIPMILIGALGSNSSGEGAGILGMFMSLVMLVLYALGFAALFFISTPLMLRSTITQDFAKAFDFGFVKRFIILMKSEMIMSALFILGVVAALMIITVVTCGIGGLVAFAASPVVFYSWYHLQKQLYKLYLSRGGDAVPVSPKLSDEAGTPPQLA